MNRQTISGFALGLRSVYNQKHLEPPRRQEKYLCAHGILAVCFFCEGMMEYKFCPRCAHPLELREAEEHHLRPMCPNCGLIVYLNPPLAAGVVAERDGKILLVLRGENPGKGLWGLPAGFMEINETVEQAARRECLEETGLNVDLGDLLGVWSYYHEVKQSAGVVVLYAARVTNGKMHAGSDSADVKFFAPEEIPQVDLAFHTHREAIARWREMQVASPKSQRAR